LPFGPGRHRSRATSRLLSPDTGRNPLEGTIVNVTFATHQFFALPEQVL